MPVSAGISILIILAVALTTFATRVTPFLVFPKGKEIPETIQYLGKVLTPAVIGMLVVYCLKSTPVREAWCSGVDCCGHGCGTACVETKQSAQYRGWNGAVYVFDSGCILIKIGTRVSKRTLVPVF